VHTLYLCECTTWICSILHYQKVGFHLPIVEFSWEQKILNKCHLIYHINSHSSKYGKYTCTVHCICHIWTWIHKNLHSLVKSSIIKFHNNPSDVSCVMCIQMSVLRNFNRQTSVMQIHLIKVQNNEEWTSHHVVMVLQLNNSFNNKNTPNTSTSSCVNYIVLYSLNITSQCTLWWVREFEDSLNYSPSVLGSSWNLHPSVTEGWQQKAITLSELLYLFLAN
jgi:hypothetical protein